MRKLSNDPRALKRRQKRRELEDKLIARMPHGPRAIKPVADNVAIAEIKKLKDEFEQEKIEIFNKCSLDIQELKAAHWSELQKVAAEERHAARLDLLNGRTTDDNPMTVQQILFAIHQLTSAASKAIGTAV